MSKVAQSVYYFAYYLLIAGFLLFFFPNQIIGIVSIAPTEEVWIHLVGALTFILGVFFMYMAKQNSREFAYISMYGRGTFILGIIVLIIFYGAPLALLLFALIDALGLIWTHWAYSRPE